MSHIVVWRPSPTATSPFGYWHHGVLCPDQTVIHYSRGRGVSEKKLGRARIECTTLRNFLWKSAAFSRSLTTTSAYVVRHPSSLDAASVVRRAESRLGDEGYHLIFNNCEHFARWCVLGAPAISTQSAAAAVAFTAGFVAAGPIGALAATVAERCATGVPSIHPNFVPLHYHYATGYIHYPQPERTTSSWYSMSRRIHTSLLPFIRFFLYSCIDIYLPL